MIRCVFGFILGCLIYQSPLAAQEVEQIEIKFQPIFQGLPLILSEGDLATKLDTLSIDIFRCYISNLQFFSNEKLVFSEPNSYHLLDADEPESLSFLLEFPKKLSFNHIEFKLGIDSLTNSKGAMEGALDPLHGMYWTWQSGYINFKLEGQAKNAPTRNQEYQYHVGGFLNGYEACPTIYLSINKSPVLPIFIDLDGFLKKSTITTNYRIMSPGPEAVQLAKLLATQFYIK